MDLSKLLHDEKTQRALDKREEILGDIMSKKSKGRAKKGKKLPLTGKNHARVQRQKR